MKKAPISSIADVTAGQGAPKPDEFADSGFADSGIPFVRAGSLEDLLAGKSESDLELVPAETAKKRKLKLYPNGSILFAKSGMSATKDRIYVLQNPAYVVSHLAILTSKDNVFRDYLRLALKQFPPSSLIKDPAYPAIGLGEIQGYEIPVPEAIDDQKRIAHLLGKVEGLIARRKQHLQQLDDLLKSVFLEMFRKLLSVEGESTLGDCLKIQQGFAFKSEEFIEHGIPVIKIGTVNKGFFDYKTLSFIANGYSDKIRRYEIRPGELLISLTGTVGKDDYGNTCFVPIDSIYPIYLLNQRVGKLICDKRVANPHFVNSFLKLPEVKSALIKQNRGVRQANLSNSDIYSIKLSIPPLDLQNQFAAIVEKVQSLKSRYQQSLTDLETLYGALSQKAFKGELDLSRVPLPVEEFEQAVIEDAKTKIQTDIEENHQRAPLSELVALTFVEGRKALLDQLLPTWLDQLGDTPFSAQHFMAHVEQRAADLIDAQDSDARFVEHEDVQFGPVEYDHLKTRVFEAMEQGRLTQGYDDANNRVQVRAAKE